jgi:hypothetical protein
MVINPKNLHPTLGTCYLTIGQSILTTWNLEPAGKGRVYMYLHPTVLKKSKNHFDLDPEVLQHHRTGFDP